MIFGIIAIVISVICLAFAIVISLKVLQTLKKYNEVNEKFLSPQEEFEKEQKGHKKQNAIDDEFMKQVSIYLFDQKLFPILRINESTNHIEVLHQNPGTSDVYTVIESLECPGKGKDSPEWKRCMALVEEATDEFIEKNKDKLVMEEMPKDAIYK